MVVAAVAVFFAPFLDALAALLRFSSLAARAASAASSDGVAGSVALFAAADFAARASLSRCLCFVLVSPADGLAVGAGAAGAIASAAKTAVVNEIMARAAAMVVSILFMENSSPFCIFTSTG